MRRRSVVVGAVAAAVAAGGGAPARAQQASPHAIEIPGWFLESFLDFKDEAATAAKAGKRLMLYFGQDGCPYCRELMSQNFSQKAIVEKTRAHFEAVALNIWGDREVTWTDGQRLSEKQFAKLLKVQFTPTLLFLDEQGRVTTRLNGYWPPHKFDAALDYVIARMDRNGTSLADHVAQHAREAANAQLADEPFFLAPPFDLRRKPGGKPLAVLWETRSCKACDEMHAEGFRRAEMKALLARFDVVRFAHGDATELVAPDGRRVAANQWARELQVAYTPSVVFFDASNREVFRFEGYVRPFHLAGSFDYVAQGAYRTQPEFQRFLQDKAERARARGQPVDIWR
ncbi:MAG: thioredoxin fold domain-containing protein [Burkholderiaceae bacterium]